MDIFSFLPIIIFFYAVFTIFGSNNKKPQNRRPDRGRPSGTPYNNPTNFPQRESKPTRPNWREMFEELERELFPKEIQTEQPSRTSSSSRTIPPDRYQSPSRSSEGMGGKEGIGREGKTAPEGVFSTEGTWGVEGRGGFEGGIGREGSYGDESAFGSEGKKGIGISKPVLPVQKYNQIENPAFNTSNNALVQGVIWAEVLGKPRAYSKFAYKRRN